MLKSCDLDEQVVCGWMFEVLIEGEFVSQSRASFNAGDHFLCSHNLNV